MGVHESTDDEVQDILLVINESNRTLYGGIIPPGLFKEPVLSLLELKGLMGRMTFYSYETEGGIVGVAALEEREEGCGQVHWVYVLPGNQRRGIGGALMERIESEARRRGLRAITAVTARRAYWARDFYASLGFELVEERDTPEGGIATFRKATG